MIVNLRSALFVIFLSIMQMYLFLHVNHQNVKFSICMQGNTHNHLFYQTYSYLHSTNHFDKVFIADHCVEFMKEENRKIVASIIQYNNKLRLIGNPKFPLYMEQVSAILNRKVDTNNYLFNRGNDYGMASYIQLSLAISGIIVLLYSGLRSHNDYYSGLMARITEKELDSYRRYFIRILFNSLIFGILSFISCLLLYSLNGTQPKSHMLLWPLLLIILPTFFVFLAALGIVIGLLTTNALNAFMTLTLVQIFLNLTSGSTAPVGSFEFPFNCLYWLNPQFHFAQLFNDIVFHKIIEKSNILFIAGFSVISLTALKVVLDSKFNFLKYRSGL